MGTGNELVDVLVVGGGAAGLGAALTLARARRSVVVVDAGQPRNAPAEGVHGLLGLEGTNPLELLARGRDEVRGYGGTILEGEVVRADTDPLGFMVELADGRQLRARQLLVATGLSDQLPDLPGVRERWGHDVLHCPYCHGWEVRDRRIGVIATGPMSVHQTLLFRQWSDNLRLFSRGVEISDEDRNRFRARGVEVVEGEVEGLEVAEDSLQAVRMADGRRFEVDAAVVASRMVANLGPFAALGLKTVEHAMGSFIEADELGCTSVAGVWVAGNATDLSAQVGAAAAQGTRVAAQINFHLVNEETELAVAAL
ncbi:NAD(P)/FAD-dependent oxidoreductase [Tessaracoccus rhinocerotis]|uniref:NAD(P)/FAD-dependent oxidoreductase n=1 Tax=Tessaracoccus rhinocerotis TaxID=1689449 RepID=A0A553K415_9ACTN|nr:NAD(P)/FAD-dependent oxidoreductase [Tessaracoccus rhinocerotis]TRY19453.1 NAD(P)/FAD-dependent oxidoreductase [Tessaracoccus rhinocerotis]